MITIGVRYLCGWSAATDVSSRTRPEWPPHAARLYMALAAAHFETRGSAAEREALEWIEAQEPPEISCSLGDETLESEIVGVYVPVNDIEKGTEALPALRPKQLRAFPRIRPQSDVAFFSWNAIPSIGIREALGGLLPKVTRLGHSSSLVQLWLEDFPPSPALKPNRVGEYALRVPAAGLLNHLQQSFNGEAVAGYHDLAEAIDNASGARKRQLKQELQQRFPDGAPVSRRPQINSWERYTRPDPSLPGSIAQSPFHPDMVVLTKQEGPSLNIESTIQLTGALRDAVIKSSVQPPPEWVSGHEPDGPPTRKPHLAFLPLPFVGGQHGDGHVAGLAIAIPRVIDRAQIRETLGRFLFNQEDGQPREIKLWKKSKHNGETVWEWTLLREDRAYPPQSLRPETWTCPSTAWASVTPVVLHHYPKKSRPRDVERILREACESADLPQPARVTPYAVSVFPGAGRAMDLPAFSEGAPRLCQYQVHATLEFHTKLEGPVLLGRGRFRGYGLFRPLISEAK